MEIVDYASYDSATVLFDVMGFGKPIDEIPLLLQTGVLGLAGEPAYALDLCLGSRKGDHNHAGLVATAMRVVNAIPAVVAADPGIRTTLDLPLVTGNGLYAAD